MFFYVSTTYSASASVTRRKAALCECGAERSCIVTRTARVSESTPERAHWLALSVASDNVRKAVPDEPCPRCGRYDPALIRHRQSQYWRSLKTLATLLLVFAVPFALLVTISLVSTSGFEADARIALTATTGICLLVAAGLLGLRRVAWKRFESPRLRGEIRPNAPLCDPIHDCDVLALFATLDLDAPDESAAARTLFQALRAGGGWSVDAALAECFRRVFRDDKAPPSVGNGVLQMLRYGSLPAVEAWLGVAPLR